MKKLWSQSITGSCFSLQLGMTITHRR